MNDQPETGNDRAPAFGPLALAGFASLGAGAIHAAAIGVHNEHQQAARAFAVLALLQIGWGALALVARRQRVSIVGLVISVAAAAGWVMAKTSGIGFVDGLGEVEKVQWPDALAAALAVLTIGILLRGLASALAGRPSSLPHRFALNRVGAAVVVVSLVGMTAVGTHNHASGHGTNEAAGHVHGATAGATADGTATTAHDHGPSAVLAPTEYDPAKPIDLSGVAGVTPAEQDRAEKLIAITLDRLPQFADYNVAEKAGFSSIGDGFTGHEHFINWNYIDDDHTLDPDHPESLVYVPQNDGTKKLVSAMFMLDAGTTLDDVPDLGGPLTQWHIHDNLCFTDDPVSPRISGITSVGGTCRAPAVKFTPVPMIHVWITKHPCGPFRLPRRRGCWAGEAG
ncbi:MAG: hypothetical protein ABIP03_06305 [Aquihabitans sp.]